MKAKDTLTILALAGVAWWLTKNRQATAGTGALSDPVVSVDNIYRGVRRGWYKATLCVVDGKPCVRLSGTVNNKPYSDVYRVSDWEAWNFMKMDGLPVE